VIPERSATAPAVDRAMVERMVANEADMAYRRRVVTIFEWLEPRDGDRILDGGCGRGFYLNFLRAACEAELWGVEFDAEIAAKAARAHAGRRGIHVVRADLERLPFAAARFDKAILSEVLEHVNDDVAVLDAVAGALKPGGLIAITVPNADYPFWWDPINKTLETVFHTKIRTGVLSGIWANHVRLYTREQLRRVVEAARLDLVEERAFTHHCFPFIHNLVYGLGKEMLEAGYLPDGMAAAADRYHVEGRRGSALNPVNVGLRLFEWFDRRNVMNEPAGRSTLNLCVLARVGAARAAAGAG
jgi:2-polyprenyl-6-hydroxyphenyl methylase/3-demethylubiquinone-9 3-methyltransferase